MISNFPQPFKDELFYSLLSRWQWLTRPPTSRGLRILFGRLSVRVLIEFPSHLSDFLSRLGSQGLNVEGIIRCHSLLPFYAPFLSSASVNIIEDSMTQNGHTGVLTRSGARRSDCRNPDPLRYCPSCVNEERARTGEAYWHRLHQTAGVLACPIHQVFLQESSVFPRSGNALHSAEANITPLEAKTLDLHNPDHSLLHRLAKDALWLLENWKPDMLDQLHERYLLLATRRSYVGPGGSFLWKRVLPDFQKRYSPATLMALQSSIPDKAFEFREFWLSCLLRHPHRVQPPIRHLLLMDFLGSSVEEILNSNPTTASSVPDKRVCQNPVCPRSRQKVAEVDSRFIRKLKRVRVRSSCPECGRISHWGKARGKEREFISEYGWAWDSKLVQLWGDHSLSIFKLAQQLGVTRASVKTQASRLRLPFPRHGGAYISKLTRVPLSVRRPELLESKRLEKRSEWLRLRAANPKASRSELQKFASSCHGWLYQNDRQWLKDNLPVLKVPPSPWQKKAHGRSYPKLRVEQNPQRETSCEINASQA